MPLSLEDWSLTPGPSGKSLCFVFAVSMVWGSFSCNANNQVPFTMLRTNELIMTKNAVISSQLTTSASQLSGSMLFLHAKNVFQVHLGKGNNLLICQGKGGIYSTR